MQAVKRREFLRNGLVLGTAGMVPGVGFVSGGGLSSVVPIVETKETLSSDSVQTADAVLSDDLLQNANIIEVKNDNGIEIKYLHGNSEGICFEYKEAKESGCPATLNVYLRTEEGESANAKIVTTAGELVTALNNSAYWGATFSMERELLTGLATWNSQGMYFDLTDPPIIIARLADSFSTEV